MIKHIIGTERHRFGIETTKVYVVKIFVANTFKTCGATQSEVASILDINEVAPEHRAIQTKVELCAFAYCLGMGNVERVAQKYPTPAKIWTDLHTRSRLGRYRLS